MDDGFVLPGLNEDYTLAGAKVSEWASGCMMALVTQELFMANTARAMPFIIVVVLVTTLGLASLRRKFPDEERGLRNVGMLALGLPPPGIPIPAGLQPYWSGAPVKAFPVDSYFEKLSLQVLFEEDGPDNEQVPRKRRRNGSDKGRG